MKGRGSTGPELLPLLLTIVIIIITGTVPDARYITSYITSILPPLLLCFSFPLLPPTTQPSSSPSPSKAFRRLFVDYLVPFVSFCVAGVLDFLPSDCSLCCSVSCTFCHLVSFPESYFPSFFPLPSSSLSNVPDHPARHQHPSLPIILLGLCDKAQECNTSDNW